jgi:type I restriction enzyme S subunit
MNADQLIAHFDRISEAPDAVVRLREFVLELAVRGKLVHQDFSEEPASSLLVSIHDRLLKLGHRNNKPGILDSDDQPFPLPSGWLWTRLGDICSKTGSGSTPRGGKSVYQTEGIPFLRSQNVYDDGLRLNDVAYIAAQTHEQMSGTALQPADMLLNITGGSIGRCCRVPSNLGPANVSQHVAIIRVAVDSIQPYLHCLIRSPYFQRFIIGEQTGAGRGGLPKNRMDQIPVALPPSDEQIRIVAKVDELMRLCDRLEESKDKREKRRNALVAASLDKLSKSAEPDSFRNLLKNSL